jgi:hypothetical protein
VKRIEIAAGKLRDFKSRGIDQIPVDLIQAEATTLCSRVHQHIHANLNEEELPQQWKKSVVVYIKWVIKITNNYQGILLSKYDSAFFSE